MRCALLAMLISLAACSPAPDPSAQPTRPVPASGPAATTPSRTLRPTPTPTPTPTPAPTASPTIFAFDVENRSRVPVVVSVASDYGATLPGFEPGERGTISIPLLNPQNGVGVEVQGTACRLLAEGWYPTPMPFTLLIEDGAQAGTIRLSARSGISATPIPLPSNSLVGCGG